MLRPLHPNDTPALLSLTADTGFFKPHEIETLREVLDDYHAESVFEGHIAQTWVEEDSPIGFVYYAPAPMTDRAWELWWIVVAQNRQGRGLGKQLYQHALSDIQSRNGRILFIETSSLEHYESTRQFYLKIGCELAAQIRDYYSDGDDKVIFAKRIEQ